jgi:ApbE superfamily uncharacterized protein (UPF0280 family)
MWTDSVSAIRARAAQARALATAMHNPVSRRELNEIADALEAEADKLSESIASSTRQPGAAPSPR